MWNTCCSCGYTLWANDEMEEKNWQNAFHQIQSCHFPIETCPHCGAPIGLHLVH